MILTQFRPDLELDVSKDGKLLVFHSKQTRSVVSFSTVTHELAGFTASMLDIPIASALAFEESLVPHDVPVPSLMPSDIDDSDGNSHTTGGGRRSFLSVAFERVVRGVADGRDALLAWTRDQGRRPVAWWPWAFNYDAYLGVIGDPKNPTWKYDKQNAAGWSIFDPAHLESSALFGGAALGVDECLAHFSMLLAWVCSSFPGAIPGKGAVAKGWTGSQQPRAVGWMLQFLTRACLLGFDTADQEFKATFLAGLGPKQHLVAFVKDLLANPLPLGADHVDARTMPVISTTEIRGGYCFQEAILFAGIGYLLRSKVLNDPLRGQLKLWAQSRALHLADRMLREAGMPYAFSTNETFNQVDVDLANAVNTDPSHHYELEGDCPCGIRSELRVADVELMVGGLALLLGPNDPTTRLLVPLLPDPGDPGYKDKARYADVFYGLLEGEAK